MSRIKGIFFDLHGTILLSDNVDQAWENWAKAFHREMAEHGTTIIFDEFKEYLKNLFESDTPDYDEPGFTLFMRRVKELGYRLGTDIPSHEIRSMVDKLVRLWHQGMYLDEDITPLVKHLQEEHTVGLITNWEHTPRIYELLDELKMHGLFDSIVISDEVQCAKPDPRIFHIALEKHELAPNEAIYIGDMDVDVQGALAAGLKPVLIQRKQSNGVWDPYTDKKNQKYTTETVHIISALSEIPSLLDRL